MVSCTSIGLVRDNAVWRGAVLVVGQMAIDGVFSFEAQATPHEAFTSPPASLCIFVGIPFGAMMLWSPDDPSWYSSLIL